MSISEPLFPLLCGTNCLLWKMLRGLKELRCLAVFREVLWILYQMGSLLLLVFHPNCWHFGSWARNIELTLDILWRSQAVEVLALVTCTACVSLVSLLASFGGWWSDGEASGAWPQAWLSKRPKVALLWHGLRSLKLSLAFKGTVTFEFSKIFVSHFKTFLSTFYVEFSEWVSK